MEFLEAMMGGNNQPLLLLFPLGQHLLAEQWGRRQGERGRAE